MRLTAEPLRVTAEPLRVTADSLRVTPDPLRVTAIVLAAGGSSRLGRPKQLLPFRGTTLVRHVAGVARAACEHVRVVLSPELRDTVDGLGVEIVENAGWSEGIASSIRRGLEGVDTAVLLLLCDQPLVTAEHLRALMAAGSGGAPDVPIVATGYRGIA
ncbi:MAG: hypothetical protein JWO56_877, partial [Acidobacteria bacterium]|nr:hypothetical protein [Acidobacteriota bacterium]